MFVLVSSFLVPSIRSSSKCGISFLTKRALDNIVDAQEEIRLIGDTEDHKISTSEPGKAGKQLASEVANPPL